MIKIESDLAFSVEPPLGQGTTADTLSGTLQADGSRLKLQLDRAVRFDTSGNLRTLRSLANALAHQGLTLEVSGPEGIMITLGKGRSNLLYRMLTGTRHIQPESLSSLWSQLWRSRGRDSTLRLVDLLPPIPMFPLAPTFGKTAHQITTTHDAEGGGRPRLLFASTSPSPDHVFYLRPGVTTIGSHADSDLLLEGLDDHHAEIRLEEGDEYVLFARGPSGTRVNGALITRQLLRTGTGIEIGNWTMSYYREEYADHGRPYGGRIGGELGHQRPQSRPVYKDPEAT